jgi:NTP pyrophosphatase (non-canonical NTP hydrolase)
MSLVDKKSSLMDIQKFILEVYGFHNDRHFSAQDMLVNTERFLMRGLKGIRQEKSRKIRLNLAVSFSWYVSLMNRLHIDLEKVVFRRFPGICSYCGSCPCRCPGKKKKTGKKTIKKPETLEDFQNMFEKIYPAEKRTIEHAGIHLAEEMGELTEAMMVYRGSHRKTDFEPIEVESADLFSCYMAVFNSLKTSLAKELGKKFHDNCHVCHEAPCRCSFESITSYKS